MTFEREKPRAYGANSTSSSTSARGGSMTGSPRTRGFNGPPAEVNATTIRNPRGGSDATRTYLLRQPHDSNNEVGRRVARGMGIEIWTRRVFS